LETNILHQFTGNQGKKEKKKKKKSQGHLIKPKKKEKKSQGHLIKPIKFCTSYFSSEGEQ